MRSMFPGTLAPLDASPLQWPGQGSLFLASSIRIPGPAKMPVDSYARAPKNGPEMSRSLTRGRTRRRAGSQRATHFRRAALSIVRCYSNRMFTSMLR